MYRLIVFILLICLFLSILSCDDDTINQPVETYQISGKVYQRYNDFLDYISGATIKIGDYVTTSDSTGSYQLNIPVGSYQFICSHSLYDEWNIASVEITKNEIINVNMHGLRYIVSGIVSHDTVGVIPNATVYLEHLENITDSEGRYIFNDIPQGIKNISCDYSDYNIYKEQINVAGADVEKNISLKRLGFTIFGTVSHNYDGLLEGIEIILDDSLYDTTDVNGDFLFSNIFIGEHILEFRSSIYINHIIDLTLNKENEYQEIQLKKLVTDTLWVEEDAEVNFSANLDGDYPSSENRGESGYLSVGTDIVRIFTHADGQIYRNHTNRFYMKLPGISFPGLDSACLLLTSIHSYNPDSIIIQKVSNSWDEMEINWINQPEVSEEHILLKPTLNENNKWLVNISKNLSLFSNPDGIRFKSTYEECWDLCTSFSTLLSSESDILENRPMVILYRSE